MRRQSQGTGQGGVSFQGGNLLGMVLPWRCRGLSGGARGGLFNKSPFEAFDLTEALPCSQQHTEWLINGIPLDADPYKKGRRNRASMRAKKTGPLKTCSNTHFRRAGEQNN